MNKSLTPIEKLDTVLQFLEHSESWSDYFNKSAVNTKSIIVAAKIIIVAI